MPYISKEFGSATLPAGGKVTLTLTITNNTEDPITNVTFEDVFPFGMTIADPNGLQNPSGLSGVTAGAGDDTITVAGASLASGEIASITVIVTMENPGVYTNTTGLLSTDEDGEIADSEGVASITVLRPSDASRWELFRFDSKTREEEEA